MSSLTTKQCTRCSEIKTIDAFFKQKNGRHGVGSFCKPCKTADQARFRRENPEHTKKQRHALYLRRKGKANAWSAAYYEKHKEKTGIYRKEWHLANKEKVNEQSRHYHKIHGDRLRKLQRKHYKENKESYAPRRQLRRARLAKAPGNHTAKQLIELKRQQKARCAYCKRSISQDFHVDHIVPLAKGGDNSIRNIQLLCPPCNMSKGAKDPIDFMQSRGFLL